MKKLVTRVLIGCIALATLSVTMAALTMAWFAGPGGKTDNQGLDGKVGLRSYFHAGTGTEGDPYEITTPTHFYNLTRLQNLGVFPTKVWFRIGHKFDGTNYQCINNCTDPNDPDYDLDYVSYLDMKPLWGTTIYPIGSEGVPFVGDFQGNGLPIRNLKVSGYPDDIGVFGYVANSAKVEGLVCDNLEVTSLGYSTVANPDPVTAADYDLYHADIDALFNNGSHKFNSQTNLDFYKYNGSAYAKVKANGLRGYNGAGVLVQAIDAPANVITVTNQNDVVTNIFYNGYFEATFPKEANDPFTYTWQSSSPLVKEVEKKTIVGGNSKDKVMAIDLKDISVVPENPTDKDFNNGTANMQVEARISLVANYVDNEGLAYSRVIQTYKLEFNSHSSTYGHGNFTVSLFCDYLNQNQSGDHFTNYKHGNNVGLLAGHVDGTLKNCFVYKGAIKLNQSGFYPINSESDRGLVGEMGGNVTSGMDEAIGKTSHGDIGSMNFSKIYSLIRDDMKPGVTVNAGSYESANYISYSKYLKDGYHEGRDAIVVNSVTAEEEAIETVTTSSGSVTINHGASNTFGSFEKFLRKSANAGTTEYITSADLSGISYSGDTAWHSITPTTIKNSFNSVDFLWNELIEDEKAVYDENDELISAAVDRGLGVFKIVTVKNDTAAAHKNDNQYGLYFKDNLGDSEIKNGDKKTKVYFSTAEKDWTKESNATFSPLRATTIPSYSDESSFEYPFSRDYNYCFELDLSQMPALGTNNYMWNTSSTFLTNYLSSILKDKYGAPITKSGANASQFGFMFISSEAERLDGLSSYMPVGQPGAKIGFDDDSDGTPDRYYPSNSIVFRIENENGANVSIVGNKGDITIYKYDSATSTGGATKQYTMKSTNVSSEDSHRYFKYDAATDQDINTTEVTEKYSGMGDGSALYGHIFNIPEPGDYVIGSETSGGANVYFLAVQGQTDASVGTTENIAKVGDDFAEIDFLTEKPTSANYALDTAQNSTTNYLGRSYIEFKTVFNTNNGTIYIDVKEINNDGKYVYIKWSEGETSFLTYLRFNIIGHRKYYVLKNSTETSYTYSYTYKE